MRALFQICLDDSGRDVDDTRIAENLALFGRVLAQLVEVCVELGQTPDELVSGLDAFELWGNERLGADRLVPRRQSGAEGRNEAREDCEFARDVRAVQVIRWVRLLNIEMNTQIGRDNGDPRRTV